METTTAKLNKTLKTKNLDALIVTNHYNILYLSGFQGISPTEREAILIVGKDYLTLITAALYQNEANKLAGSKLKVKIARERNEYEKFIHEALKNTQRIGFEESNLTVSELKRFKKLVKGKKFVSTKNLIEDLRIIKTEEEIKKVEKAQIISQKAFERILKTVKVGQTEEEIAHKLLSIIQNLGGQGLAFETIIASGPNAGLPHHRTGKRKIKKDEVLLFDFGTKYQNYCADLSRTIFVGKGKNEHKNIYMHVKNAQAKALEKVANNILAKHAHNAANNVFKELRLENNFIHGLGHGIGLEVHEAPHVRAKGKDKLTHGMVFSVEPGLYFPWGGVRIEDLVTIKNGKAKVLGKTQEEIIEV